ncbi:MAG: hypothetical protein PHR35_02190 [Kiritimatiellae bacterium]|nr:hypothetical protein [Kiritimatiellia bacterium]
MTALHVFNVSSPNERALNVEEVYATPSRLRYDTHWTLTSWDIPHGTVRLSCRFGVDVHYLGGTNAWYRRDYVVPIDCRPAD